jgi:hypothetical protein
MKFLITNEHSRRVVFEYLEKLNLSKKYSVEITLKREVRTLSQNRLYWLYLACLEQETGNDKEALHYFFKRKWLRRNTTELQNEQIISVYSTKELNTVQFKQYIDKIVLFAAEEGIILPDPNDLAWSQFYETYKDK